MNKRAVIIGTGMGGLTAAAYLAKEGFEVLALEQGEHFGGYSCPFFRGDFQFDPGVHYIGECEPGALVHQLLAGVSIDATALFAELDPEGFDVYRFPGFAARCCRGLDRYRERLARLFPRSAADLRRFFSVVEAYQGAMRIMEAVQQHQFGLAQLRALTGLPTVLRWGRVTLGALLKGTVGDPRLRSVLAAACGDYGLPPGRAAALAGLSLLDHYSRGAFFPRGGSARLRDALVQAAERSGARFRARARVIRILTRDGRAVGVELEGGERIDADTVVSDADPVSTLGQMLEPGVLPARLRRKVARTRPSLATFAVYLGMQRDLRQHGLGRFNVWDYPDWDIDALYAPCFEGRLPREPVLFISPNSLKDDSGSLAPPGASTLEIITLVPYAMFERWRDRPVGARGQDYAAEKERVGSWILEAVERRWPGLVGDVVVREMSTPVTNESYTLAVKGGAYGPELTPEQAGFRRFRTATPVAGLFLAGAGVFGDGIAPCMSSGRIAAQLAMRAAAPARRRTPWLRRWREVPA